jgi:C-terminal processing protease CtpA/Prc
VESIHFSSLGLVAQVGRPGRTLLTEPFGTRPSPHRALAAWAIALAIAEAGCAEGRGSIGAVLSQSNRDGTVIARRVPPGMAAARAGLERGDEVLFIDGKDVRTMSPDAIHESLEGSVGSKVRLTVLRRGKVERLEIERAPLQQGSDFRSRP